MLRKMYFWIWNDRYLSTGKFKDDRTFFRFKGHKVCTSKQSTNYNDYSFKLFRWSITYIVSMMTFSVSFSMLAILRENSCISDNLGWMWKTSSHKLNALSFSKFFCCIELESFEVFYWIHNIKDSLPWSIINVYVHIRTCT